MNKYKILSNFMYYFHYFWLFLLFCSAFAAILDFHRTIAFVITFSTVASQIIFGGHCPMTILHDKWRRKYDPEAKLNEGFTVRIIRKWFGLEVSPWVVTAVLITILIVTTLGIFEFIPK